MDECALCYVKGLRVTRLLKDIVIKKVFTKEGEWKETKATLCPDHLKEVEESKDFPVIETEKIGRNEKCPCGSGKKFKKCHGR